MLRVSNFTPRKSNSTASASLFIISCLRSCARILLLRSGERICSTSIVFILFDIIVTWGQVRVIALLSLTSGMGQVHDICLLFIICSFSDLCQKIIGVTTDALSLSCCLFNLLRKHLDISCHLINLFMLISGSLLQPLTICKQYRSFCLCHR